MRGWTAAILAAALLLPAAAQAAAEIRIVALGASNTYGSGRGSHRGGVSPSLAYPAQLQRLLRARGFAASVRNAGVPGDTTGGMLARLNSAVPKGTSIVILDPGGNDARRGLAGTTAGNIEAIRQRLAARGIKLIVISRLGRIAPRDTLLPDRQHFNARGHAAIAAYLVPLVMEAARAE